jgi:hypothetical protein
MVSFPTFGPPQRLDDLEIRPTAAKPQVEPRSTTKINVHETRRS